MTQKIVTFEVAKALKDAGYPQVGRYQYTYAGELLVDLVREGGICYGPMAPSYLDAWLWMWNTKNIQIEVADKSYFAKAKVIGKVFVETNPEEAIANAIGFLVENNLIK